MCIRDSPGIRTSQISQKVDEALNNRRVDVALSGEVVEGLAILGRIAGNAIIGWGDGGTAARDQANDAYKKKVRGVKLHRSRMVAQA